MTNLVFVRNGQAFTTSEIVAAGVENQHKNVLEIIRKFLPDFEEFGRVAFKTLPFKTPGGVQQKAVALLNEQQATLLVTYCRNTEKVRAFKVALVKAFYEARGGAQKITYEQCKLLMSAIGKRAETAEDYRRLYNALNTRFNVRSYTDIPFDCFDEALAVVSELPAAPSDDLRYQRLARMVLERNDKIKERCERVESLLRTALQDVASIRDMQETQRLLGAALNRCQ